MNDAGVEGLKVKTLIPEIFRHFPSIQCLLEDLFRYMAVWSANGLTSGLTRCLRSFIYVIYARNIMGPRNRTL